MTSLLKNGMESGVNKPKSSTILQPTEDNKTKLKRARLEQDDELSLTGQLIIMNIPSISPEAAFSSFCEFNSPSCNDYESSKTSGTKKERTPRTLRRLQKQHRDNERYRHQNMNAIIKELSYMLPGHGRFGKETKIQTLKKLISYICYLEEYATFLMSRLGLGMDFRDLMLHPSLTHEDLELARHTVCPLKVDEKKPENQKVLSQEDNRRKLSSPTIDSTTTEVPTIRKLGPQAYIQLQDGEMTPIGMVKQGKDGSNYITIPQTVTSSGVCNGGTIYIPSLIEFQPTHKIMSSAPISSSCVKSPEVMQTKSAVHSPSFSPFSSPSTAQTPFLRNTGEATPLLSQTSITMLSPKVLETPGCSMSQGSDPWTPSKLVDSTTLTSTLTTQSELPLDSNSDEDELCMKKSPKNYLDILSLIRESKQDVASYAADCSIDSLFDVEPIDEPVFYKSYKKPKSKKKKKCQPSHSRGSSEPVEEEAPFMFYDVGKYVKENRASNQRKMRMSNNSAAASLFENADGLVSSTPYEWKFHDQTAELVHNEMSRGSPTLEDRPCKVDHRKTSWMNGFMMFSRLHRRDFIDVNPGIATAQISKLLGHTWRSMSAEEQEPYKEKAKSYVDNLTRMYAMSPDFSISPESSQIGQQSEDSCGTLATNSCENSNCSESSTEIVRNQADCTNGATKSDIGKGTFNIGGIKLEPNQRNSEEMSNEGMTGFRPIETGLSREFGNSRSREALVPKCSDAIGCKSHTEMPGSMKKVPRRDVTVIKIERAGAENCDDVPDLSQIRETGRNEADLCVGIIRDDIRSLNSASDSVVPNVPLPVSDGIEGGQGQVVPTASGRVEGINETRGAQEHDRYDFNHSVTEE